MLIIELEKAKFCQKQIKLWCFFATRVKAIYLALINEYATISGIFEHQWTWPLLNLKIKSNIDFWFFLLSAQSEFK